MSASVTNGLTAVWGTSSTDVYVAGFDGNIMHWDGIRWVPVRSNAANHILQVWGANDAVFFVGGQGNALRITRAQPCRDWDRITCGDSLAATNATGASHFASYRCAAEFSTGPESYFRFDAQESGQVTVTVSGMSARLDLIVVGADPWGACAPVSKCIDASQTSATQEVSFAASAGKAYYLIVDGYAGSTSSFDISVSCP